MIEYRPALPSDSDAIASLHTRSWRENYRGAFSDAFLDGELPEERMRAWRARLDHPPENQFVQLAFDGANLRVDIKNACENIRSVLDYLAADIREHYCPTASSSDRFYFPILPDKKTFDARIDQWFPGL